MAALVVEGRVAGFWEHALSSITATAQMLEDLKLDYRLEL